MPLYEYRCEDCGNVTEIIAGVGGIDEEPVCSNCGGKKMNKIMSAAWTPSKMKAREPGKTCCGADERCDKPPCSGDGPCCKQ